MVTSTDAHVAGREYRGELKMAEVSDRAKRAWLDVSGGAGAQRIQRVLDEEVADKDEIIKILKNTCRIAFTDGWNAAHANEYLYEEEAFNDSYAAINLKNLHDQTGRTPSD
jgi:hypothetical protein